MKIKFRNHQVKKQRGNMAMQALVGGAILGLAGTAAVVAWQTYSGDNQASSTANGMITTVAKVKKAYMGNRNYAGLTTEIATNQGMVDPTFYFIDSATQTRSVINPFSDNIIAANSTGTAPSAFEPLNVGPNPSGNSGFVVSVGEIPGQEACAEVASNLMSSSADDVEIYVNDDGSGGVQIQDPTQAYNTCVAGNNYVALLAK